MGICESEVGIEVLSVGLFFSKIFIDIGKSKRDQNGFKRIKDIANNLSAVVYGLVSEIVGRFIQDFSALVNQNAWNKMRDIFKILRCKGSNEGAAKTNDMKCEENKEDKEHGENGSSEETTKLLNGGEEETAEVGKEENGKAGDDEEVKNDDKEEEMKKDVEEDVKEDVKEDGKEQETNGGGAVAKEEVAVEESQEEGDRLITNNEEDKDEKKNEKKSKKKEPSRWMCGLGRKSSGEKGKKKKENHCKKEEEKLECEEDATEEKTEENANAEEKDDDNEVEEGEKQNEGEVEQSKDEEDKKERKDEKVVVFVAESEAVVEEKIVEETKEDEKEKEECSVRGDGLTKAKKNEPASFEIHGIDEALHFKCKIHDEHGNEVAVEVEEVSDDDKLHYKATYHPTTAGLHVIEATWKGDHIVGSPFQAQVDDIEES
eukprot:gene12313-13583_t